MPTLQCCWNSPCSTVLLIHSIDPAARAAWVGAELHIAGVDFPYSWGMWGVCRPQSSRDVLEGSRRGWGSAPALPHLPPCDQTGVKRAHQHQTQGRVSGSSVDFDALGSFPVFPLVMPPKLLAEGGMERGYFIHIPLGCTF